MRIKIPKYIIVDDERYQLYLDYKKNPNGPEWVWNATYVCDHGILQMNIAPDPTLSVIETKVMSWMRDHHVDFE